MLHAVRRRLTFANVVAVIAVFLALGGGTVYAASKLINGKLIKPNSEPGNRIKKNSLTGDRLQNNSVTGSKIIASTLGTVPNATHSSSADHAASADHATSADLASAVSGLTVLSFHRITATDGASQSAAEAAAPQIPLFSKGTLSLYAKCFHDTSTDTVYGEVYLATTQDGAYLDSTSQHDGTTDNTSPTFIDTGTAESSRGLYTGTHDSATANSMSYEEADDSTDFTAVGPDGTTISGAIVYGEKNGTLTGEQGAFGAGNVCLVGGHVIG